jgi:hypothetical protein
VQVVPANPARDTNGTYLWWAYGILSDSYHQVGDIASHISAAEESARQAEITGNPEALMGSTAILGFAALNRGDLTAATMHQARAKRYAVEFASPDWLARSHVLLAAVLNARGQPEHAREQIECAIELDDGRIGQEKSQLIMITHGEILAALGDRAGPQRSTKWPWKIHAGSGCPITRQTR